MEENKLLEGIRTEWPNPSPRSLADFALFCAESTRKFCLLRGIPAGDKQKDTSDEVLAEALHDILSDKDLERTEKALVGIVSRAANRITQRIRRHRQRTSLLPSNLPSKHSEPIERESNREICAIIVSMCKRAIDEIGAASPSDAEELRRYFFDADSTGLSKRARMRFRKNLTFVSWKALSSYAEDTETHRILSSLHEIASAKKPGSPAFVRFIEMVGNVSSRQGT